MGPFNGLFYIECVNLSRLLVLLFPIVICNFYYCRYYLYLLLFLLSAKVTLYTLEYLITIARLLLLKLLRILLSY